MSAPAAAVAAAFQVSPPTKFDFKKPEEWPKWIKRFERFRIASGLESQPEESQVNTLIYTMGDEAEDVLTSLNLTDEEANAYETLVAKLESHFVVRRNVIFERAKFNQRQQEIGETADAFITSLYSLAEHCGYGALHSEMIRDRLVVGIRDKRLSEQLQMDSKLTLDKAVLQIRQSELVKKQQDLMKNNFKQENVCNVDSVKTKTKTFNRPVKTKRQAPDKYIKRDNSQCNRCGKTPSHSKHSCPAKDVFCNQCKKKAHYARVCRSGAIREIQVAGSDSDASEVAFLGSVASEGTNDAWLTTVKVNNLECVLKIDTGADVTVLPEKVYKSLAQKPQLQPAKLKLFGAGMSPLTVKGKFTANLSTPNKTTEQTVYVVADLIQGLLSRSASVALGLVARVEAVSLISVEAVKQRFPKLFSGLGKMEGEYKIELKEDAKPFALTTPRRVPLPLLPKVKKELARMEELGVISRVEQPTDWCAGMVPIPKRAEEEVRVCVDLTKLNDSVKRERHMLPSVEHTLGQLEGAKIFSKLDANSGFWQIPLSRESALLTTFITPFGRFCFNRLCFGISSAPEHFQKRMSQLLEGLDGVVCQMDDILVYAETQTHHDARLVAVLERLEKAGVTLKSEKCEFSKTSIKFLGQIIDSTGVKADPEKVKAVTNMEAPSDVRGVRRFLGMVNHLGKYLPHLAEKTQPLRDLLSSKNMWCWGEAQQKAFNMIKSELSKPPNLALYNPKAQTTVSADASSFGLGAVLLQKQEDSNIKPVAFASRALTPTEQRYAQIEKEALAITWACERFSDFLIGMDFHIETDHKPLVPLLGSKNLDELPPRVQRLRMRLMRFIEVAKLTSTTSAAVIEHMKSIFARHGIPAEVRSDNGPQFSSELFKTFATEWSFVHTTSSPRFPQSNGEAERAVRTVKSLLQKESDPYLALMAYRATPLSNSHSPAELLMGRKLRTTVPILPSCLKPGWTDITMLREKERRERKKQWRWFNNRHRAHDLTRLNPGDQVWITDMKEEGTVSGRADTPRSYLVQTPKGLLRRNRSHLVTLTGTNSDPVLSESANQPPDTTLPTLTANDQTSAKRYPTRERNPPRYLKDFELDRRYSQASE
ncbi:hypothetical protein WMY93_027550 [Mugilogobius chulae]|uniref:ribonuclease H n=1 Tax=Mugilogobius chulae TaxID=88201 RepID=A0AAW0N530_9GOBI